jgi:iron complex transport system substrate-binding protein
MTAQRIVSLLPAATEMVSALGLVDRLVGRSHECDHPLRIRGLPALTATDIDGRRSSGEIHQQVGTLLEQGGSLYRLDEAKLAELQPDLVITQSTCQVCALPFEVVSEATRRLLPPSCRLISMNPSSAAGVLDDLRAIGEAAGVPAVAAQLVASLQARAQRLRDLTDGLDRPRVLALEWLDPPMVAGHWTPELIEWAGGEPVLGHPGQPTRPVTWEELAAARPEVLLLLPCGFTTSQTRAEIPALWARPGVKEWPAVQRRHVVILDGNGHFNRPGPRLWDSAELAGRALWPQLEMVLGPPADPSLLVRLTRP